MVFRRVALRLCPTRGVLQVALLWPFLHLNPWVQQYPSGSYNASSSHPFVFRGVFDLVVGKVASTIFKSRWLSSESRWIVAIVVSNCANNPLLVSVNLSIVDLSVAAAIARLSSAISKLLVTSSCVAACAPKLAPFL